MLILFPYCIYMYIFIEVQRFKGEVCTVQYANYVISSFNCNVISDFCS